MRVFRNIFIWGAFLLLGHSTLAQVVPYSKSFISKNSNWFFPGKIAIKVDARFSNQDNIPALDVTNAHWQSGLSKLGVQNIAPLFAIAHSQNPPTPKNSVLRNQMKTAGLGQWFVLTMPSNTSLADAWDLLSLMPGVIVAEPMPRYNIFDWPNDALLANQWQYSNSGQNGGLAGADINLAPAWQVETGKPQVLVAITDGGVDTAHPDLKQNLWSGIGFNFVNPSQALDADGHATHVAGVVAATRNNGIGIAGIAGGNGSASSGIRYMSLQIVGGGSGEAGAEAEAFIFAANKGVAISQNSWGYFAPNIFPGYTREAIDFFIDNGGGNLMKGGIAIFAAGNASTNQTYFPGAYHRVMTVAASNNKDAITSYSNYGNWISITAPGGDFAQGLAGGIYSTEAAGNYGYRQGTSMAAPHVSGVAALLLSMAPNRFLPDDLRYLLESTADNIDNRNTALYKNNMGAGRLNAGKAIQATLAISKLPILQPVSNIEGRLSPDCKSVDLTWKNGENNMGVMVALSENGRYGFPIGQSFEVGDTIKGGGVVLLKGNATALRVPLGVDGSTMAFRIWTFDSSSNNYSVGEDFEFDVPYTVFDTRATAAETSITLEWERKCPNRPVLLAWNTGSTFGKPSGSPNGLTQIAGGGMALQFGTQSNFRHENLNKDQVYYYAFYPYTEINGKFYYAEPQILASGTLCGETALPLRESFVSGNMPPEGWRLVDGGPQGTLQPDGRTWRWISGWSADGDGATAVLPAYLENGNSSKEILRSPGFTKSNSDDTLMLSFSYAYRAYSSSESLADSLEVAFSTDCGASKTILWSKGGTSLSTVQGTQTAEYIPKPEEWKTVNIDLSQLINTGEKGSILFIGTNKFGQNIWLDNISITSKKALIKDLELIAEPQADYSCNGRYPVKLLLKNKGNRTVESASVNLRYSNNNQTVTFRNLQLNEGSDTSFIWILDGNPGSYAATFSLADKDDNAANDTSRLVAHFSGKTTLPYSEGFEFIPPSSIALGWVKVNDEGNAWRITNEVAATGGSSLVFEGNNTNAERISAVLPLAALPADIDSLILEFYTAATNNSNTLTMRVVSGCGTVSSPVQDILPSPNDPSHTGGNYLPAPGAPWRYHRINILPFLSNQPAGTEFQISLDGNATGGTRFFVDNISLRAVTLPQALKERGYGIYPVPIGQSFTVWHLKPPVDLRAISIYNALGQLVWRQQYATNAPQTIRVNSAAWLPGMYEVHLQYNDRRVVEKILK